MVKQRSIVTCIILSIITCGIYGIYWFVCLTNDVNYVSGEEGTSGGLAVLLTIITCGIYGLYWAYKMGEKLDIAKQKQGIPATNGGILYLILFIFGGIISYAVIQYELNKLV
ncbi:MAG: DUF4234 domain-containing protein [Cellulosilyticum sp.]|nr:DUF4234 domain-containing protein [Cellulosilyticum sp.]